MALICFVNAKCCACGEIIGLVITHQSAWTRFDTWCMRHWQHTDTIFEQYWPARPVFLEQADRLLSFLERKRS